jgi:UDP-N-acetylglucosamine 4,6-dehydratase/5-epimerase
VRLWTEVFLNRYSEIMVSIDVSKEKIMDIFDGKILLITGGTGSFGHAVVDRFLKTGIKEIRIVSRDEKKQDDMRKLYQNDKLKFYIGDVRDYSSIVDAFKGVDYVFSAAALKQVPSCEFYPLEAMKTNVIGSNNVITASVANHVKNAIFLSTDKAAYPINAMGITKALMEKNVIARSRQLLPGDTILCLTRYGNVMASRGSVIPLFLDQIKAGKPITITNPDMTRFMMTLEDAVNLVLFAFQHGKQGDLFVQKAPAATIETLAKAVIALTGSKSGIKYIGTRHGEKLFETLVTSEEMERAVDEGDFFRIPADNRDLNYDKYVDKGNHALEQAEPYTSHNTERLNLKGMEAQLLRLGLFADKRSAK